MKTISSMILGMAIAASAVLAAEQPAARRVEVGDLVCEWFAHMAVYGPAGEWRMSGWDVEPPGPNPFAHAYYSWFKLVDKDDKAPVTIGRRFPMQQDGVLTWEFVFRLPQLTNGPVFQIMSGEQGALRLYVAEGALMADAGEGAPRRLTVLQADRDCGVSVRLDLDAHRADIRVDGRMAATAVPLPDKALDRLAITTGGSFVGELFMAPVLLHRGYALRESFISVPEGAMPEGWTSTTAGGKAGVRAHGGAAHPANSRALCLERTQAGALDATVAFPPVKSAVEAEAKVWLPDGGNGASVAWLDATGRPVVTLAARDGAWSASGAGGAPVSLWAGLRKTVWYNLRVVIDPAAKSATCYVNDIERGRVAIAAGAQVAQMRVTAPEAVGGQCWADELVVRPHLPYPADYAPEPVPVATGSNIVMMQSCDLWREGLHNGWDYLRGYPERRPLLGYYNGGDPEVEDWTIGWLLRNGISCDFKCWYRGELGQPIHTTRHGEGLIGFKRARWSGKMKFALNLTNHRDFFASLDDWRDNVVPYLIEHLFRDPRYLTIDNQPFVGIFDAGWLNKNTKDAKAALSILREECRKAGFDGCWVVNQGGPSKDASGWGFDAVYAYTWFTGSGEQQKKNIESQRAHKTEDVLPTLSMGWNPSPWKGGGGSWVKPDEFRALCEWAKTTYMPSGASNALSRRVVMLDNWNEWGEGHCMMPAAGWGFGYLHAVRDTFGQPPFPPDVQPTPAQRSRLTTLYPRDQGDMVLVPLEKGLPPRAWNDHTNGIWSNPVLWGGTTPGSNDTVRWVSRNGATNANEIAVDGQRAIHALLMDWVGDGGANQTGVTEVSLRGTVPNARLAMTSLWLGWGTVADVSIQDRLTFSNMDLTVGSTESPGTLAMGNVKSRNSSVALVAGANSSFFAHLRTLQLGTIEDNGWNIVLGTLDLNAATSVTLNVDGNVELASWLGDPKIGNAQRIVNVAIRNGRVTAGNLYMAYSTSSAEVEDGDCPRKSATLVLHSNTVFQVAASGRTVLGGRGGKRDYQSNQALIQIAAGAGLDLQNPSPEGLVLKWPLRENDNGGLLFNQIVITLPGVARDRDGVKNGWLWGLRWKGNHVTGNTQRFRTSGTPCGLRTLLDPGKGDTLKRLRVITTGLSDEQKVWHLDYLKTLDAATYGQKTIAQLTTEDYVIYDPKDDYTYVGVYGQLEKTR